MNLIEKAIKIFRVKNPHSRRIRGYYLSRNGCRKREYACSFCNKVLDSECALYPMTKHSYNNIQEHVPQCAKNYLKENE